MSPSGAQRNTKSVRTYQRTAQAASDGQNLTRRKFCRSKASLRPDRTEERSARLREKKWGPALLPAPTAPSEGSAGVRSTWSLPENRSRPRFSILAHQLRRRFPPNRSLFRGARPIYQTAPPEGSLVFRPFRPGVWNRSPSKPKPSSVPRPFLGRPLSRPASLTDGPKTVRSRVALEEDRLFRRLFPAGPEKNPKALPTACRRRSDLWSPAASSCRFRLLERPGPPSRSPMHHEPVARVGEAKNALRRLWIMWISGTTITRYSGRPFTFAGTSDRRAVRPTSGPG
jgi:hypothetical protein